MRGARGSIRATFGLLGAKKRNHAWIGGWGATTGAIHIYLSAYTVLELFKTQKFTLNLRKSRKLAGLSSKSRRLGNQIYLHF